MTQSDAMTALLAAKGKTITIDGETFTVEGARVTYGAGVCMTLDRPRPGRSSRLLTVAAGDDPFASINLATTIA